MAEFKAEVDTDGLEEKFAREAARLRDNLRETLRAIGDDAELVFAAHALRKTGRMARGVRAQSAGDTVLVTVHAENPETGFDYVAVTRFGHRKRVIKPRHAPRPGRYLAPIPGVGPRWVNKRAALRTPFGFRASVRGFKPSGDWALRALPQVRRSADREMKLLGQQIVVRLGS